MTAKEKAIALIDLFYDNVDSWNDHYDELRDEQDILEDVKKICIKHIEEILNIDLSVHQLNYWQDVKIELLKL